MSIAIRKSWTKCFLSTTADVIPTILKNLPIPVIGAILGVAAESLVKQYRAAKKENANADTKQIESKLEELVNNHTSETGEKLEDINEKMKEAVDNEIKKSMGVNIAYASYLIIYSNNYEKLSSDMINFCEDVAKNCMDQEMDYDYGDEDCQELYEYMRDWYNEILFDSIYVWDNAIVINFEGNEYVDSQFRDKITYLIQKINNVSEDVQFNMYELGY
ncbi:MAG: hypothetical protein IJX85_06675 [Lachnospiraceae bacterium]|nr:hypothetical protein [Lachnospiraceae bacterium]